MQVSPLRAARSGRDDTVWMVRAGFVVEKGSEFVARRATSGFFDSLRSLRMTAFDWSLRMMGFVERWAEAGVVGGTVVATPRSTPASELVGDPGCRAVRVEGGAPRW